MTTTAQRWLVTVLLIAAPLATVQASEKKEAKKRAEIDSKASDVLSTVLADGKGAQALYDSSVGYAVFNNTKAAFGVSGGGGSGVAVAKSGSREYMKMGTVGVGFGIGVKSYQVLMLFENSNVFENFVEEGWQGDSQASAAAGDDGVGAEASFHDGMAIFVLTKKGLMANADVSGTKYWKSDLN